MCTRMNSLCMNSLSALTQSLVADAAVACFEQIGKISAMRLNVKRHPKMKDHLKTNGKYPCLAGMRWQKKSARVSIYIYVWISIVVE